MKSYAEALKADAHNRIAMTDDPAASGSYRSFATSASGPLAGCNDPPVNQKPPFTRRQSR